MLVRSSETRIVLIGVRGWHQHGWKKRNMAPMWKKLMKHVDLDEPTSFLDHVYLGCTQRECKPNGIIMNVQLPGWTKIISKRRNLSPLVNQIVLTCLYMARIGRPDIVWSVNMLARSVTKWTGACDRRLARLISYIDHTSDNWQYCHVGSTAQHCRLGLFQRSDFAGDLVDSTSTSREILRIFESRTFVTVSWMCKKQTSVSHSSTESEIISLDAGLRMDGIPALGWRDVVIQVLRSSNSTKHQPTPQQDSVHEETHPNPNKRENKMLINCRIWTTSPQTQILLKASLVHIWRQWSSDQNDR